MNRFTKLLLGLLILIVVLISGRLISKPPEQKTIDYEKPYTLILSSEEQNIVGMWESQSGETTFIFKVNRSGSRIGKDKGRVVGSNDYKWRILKYPPNSGDVLIDTAGFSENERLVIQTFYPDGNIITESYSYYLINEKTNSELFNTLGKNDMLILKDFSGAKKDVNFHRVLPKNEQSYTTISNATEIKSLVEQNIVIVIDSSPSMAGDDPSTGFSFIGLSNANALNIIRNTGRCNYVGVVTFGVVTKKTDLLLMESEVNKTKLEKFIRDNVPKIGGKSVNLDKGLLEAEDLLNTVNGKKEIIIISDGLMPKKGEGFENIKNEVIDLKNSDIQIHFLQVLLGYEASKEPNRLYDELAQAADVNVIVLNPDERANILREPIFKSNEPCSTPIPTK